MGLKWVCFFTYPTSTRKQNTQLVGDGYQIQIKAIAALLITLGARTNISFIIKVNSSCAHQMAM